jgi:hypothetical protein
MPEQNSYKFGDEPTTFKLKFNQPKQGEGVYGRWNLYGAIINGQETSFFAPAGLHEKIQFAGMKANDEGTIQKMAKINNQTNKPYVEYDLTFKGTKIIVPKNSPNAPVRANIAIKDAVQNRVADEKKWNSISWGKCKYGFLIEAFKRGMTIDEALPVAEAWADAAMEQKVDDIQVSDEQFPPADTYEQDEIDVKGIPF